MADETQRIDEDFGNSIAMLEQIVEVMPQAAMALKALYNAYNQSGQRDRALEYLGKLSDVVCESNDIDLAEFLIEELQGFAEDFPAEAAAQLARLRTLVYPAIKEEATTESVTSPLSSTSTDISEELALAWRLYEENQLSQEEYSSVLHDLTDISSKELNVPVSVLHVLYDRGFNKINRVMNHMSSRSGVPCISLLNFGLPEEIGDVLPLAVAAHEGALPFGFFGDDLLVGVLNPFNNVLLDKVEKIGGRRIHTYLVSPNEYDAVLEKLRSMAK